MDTLVRYRITPLAVGVLFGLGLERSKVYLPAVIAAQMNLTSFQMMKTFLTATAVGMGVVVALDGVKSVKSRLVKPPRALGLGLFGGYGSNVLGGLMLGTGMTLSGACPGTLLAQLGAGLWNPYALLGAIVGTMTVGPFADFMTKRYADHGKTSHPICLDEKLNRRFADVAAVVGLSMMAGVALIDSVFDWRSDLAGVLGSWGVAAAWSPLVGGALLGAMQLPLLVVTREKMLGCASGWATLIGSMGLGTNPGSWWQLTMDVGIIIGARLSVMQSGFVPVPVVSSPVSAFFGGLFILFGGRLGGGCTSGHGLSGMAQLSMASFVTVACMFAGGMAMSALLGR